MIPNFLLNPLPNIYISGENYSLNQSWVNGALDSCEKLLPLITNNNAQNEYYLTDIISLCYEEGHTIEAVHPEENIEVEGIYI